MAIVGHTLAGAWFIRTLSNSSGHWLSTEYSINFKIANIAFCTDSPLLSACLSTSTSYLILSVYLALHAYHSTLLSGCKIQICAQSWLFRLHSLSAAWVLQLLKSGTLSLQLFECVPTLTLFVIISRLTISSRPSNLLREVKWSE